ncbi:hypothetical protein [Streptomyces shenzhenensis]|uniref:hypothetical protein n=1 Tax=Streptomyces shenzhenensis TaxID=943815 RepID=UPI001F1D7D06|nr:hypothetical protein [Streptomyces shenzhenensis]
MEQRIGANSQPLEGAGFDPAFIPGLTSPASARPQDARPEKAEDAEAAAEPVAEAEVEVEDTVAEDDERTPEGPAFEAADRRARIVADHQGVRLSLDEEKCEFRWDEIGAVETETPRFGKRFTITVHTPDRRWYPIEIEATSRSRFKEWEEQLDAVLDAYFDDGEKAEDDALEAQSDAGAAAEDKSDAEGKAEGLDAR